MLRSSNLFKVIINWFSWQLHISSEWHDLHLHKRIKVKDKHGARECLLLLVLKKLSIASGALNYLIFYLFLFVNTYSLVFSSWTIYSFTLLVCIRQAFDPFSRLVLFWFFFKNTGVCFFIKFILFIYIKSVNKWKFKSEPVWENIEKTLFEKL